MSFSAIYPLQEEIEVDGIDTICILTPSPNLASWAQKGAGNRVMEPTTLRGMDGCKIPSRGAIQSINNYTFQAFSVVGSCTRLGNAFLDL